MLLASRGMAIAQKQKYGISHRTVANFLPDLSFERVQKEVTPRNILMFIRGEDPYGNYKSTV